MSKYENNSTIYYKYMSLPSAVKILESNSIAFSNPCCFNDPFETKATYNKRNDFLKKTGIACFTRSSLNPLMWAHYGVEHTGVVIGFKCNVESLSSKKKCIIPIQHGNVIYTDTKPNGHTITGISKKTKKLNNKLQDGMLFNYREGFSEQLQRNFLYKPVCWSYEEEVRVVKSVIDENSSRKRDFVENKCGIFTKKDIDDFRSIYIMKLEKDCIKEIVFGTRFTELEKISDALDRYEELKIYQALLSKSSWGLSKREITKKLLR